METHVAVIVMLGVCSINMPKFAMICGFVILLGRFLYSVGYCMKGPKGRMIGGIIVDIALIAVLVGAIMSIINWELNAE